MTERRWSCCSSGAAVILINEDPSVMTQFLQAPQCAHLFITPLLLATLGRLFALISRCCRSDSSASFVFCQPFSVFFFFNVSRNPTPGILINKPNGSDVYKGVPKDYTGEVSLGASRERSVGGASRTCDF